ncbi:hypothetical protein ACROYT_G007469 [Oculina patagonica]
MKQAAKLEKIEKDGGQEKVASEILVQSPENEVIQAAVYESEALIRFSTYAVWKQNQKPAHEGGGEELLAELEKVRQEKLESEKTAQELRIELDSFVREKERIVNELKARIQKLLAEKEESSSLVEHYEKLLLDRDAEISSLGEQFQSLSEERDDVNRKLAENRTENQNLKALLEQLQLQKVKAERELQQAKLQIEQLLQGHQPSLDNKDQQITDLETELSNQKALYTKEMSHLKDRYETVLYEQQNHVNNLEGDSRVSKH